MNPVELSERVFRVFRRRDLDRREEFGETLWVTSRAPFYFTFARGAEAPAKDFRAVIGLRMQ